MYDVRTQTRAVLEAIRGGQASALAIGQALAAAYMQGTTDATPAAPVRDPVEDELDALQAQLESNLADSQSGGVAGERIEGTGEEAAPAPSPPAKVPPPSLGGGLEINLPQARHEAALVAGDRVPGPLAAPRGRNAGQVAMASDRAVSAYMKRLETGDDPKVARALAAQQASLALPLTMEEIDGEAI